MTAQRQGLALQNRLAACQARGKCRQCQQTLNRGSFWPGDWPNRHKYGIKCTTCEPRAPGERDKTAVKGVLPEAFRESNEARQDALDALVYACSKCLTEKSRGEFLPYDLNNRKNRPLLCKTCRPTPPEERKAAKESQRYACDNCKLEKPRSEYWPKDIYKWTSAGAVHLCKTCNPTPPEQRQRQYRCQSCKQSKPLDDYWQGDFDNRSSAKLACKTCRPAPPEQRQRQRGSDPRSSSARPILKRQ